MISYPKTVYLDTQDFSRFGEVVRGKSDQPTKEIFEYLLTRLRKNEARFVYSMVTLSELLQYDPEFEQKTLARAEAVELLCRGWCCINPSRLMAREAARLLGHENDDCVDVIQPGNDWTPNISNVFSDFESRLAEAKQSIVNEFRGMNRRARKIAEKGASDRAFSRLLAEAAPVIAAEYGLSENSFLSSFLLLHKKKITSEEASRRFFSAVARPTGFVHTYFKKYEGEKDFPHWIGRAGQKLQLGLQATVANLASVPLKSLKSQWDHAFESMRQKMSYLVLGLAAGENDAFGVSDEELKALSGDKAIQEIEPVRVCVDLMKAYLAQAVGIHGSKAKVEPGFGGDFMHSLYLPYVDIWRSDIRFAALAKTTNTATVCSRLNQLTDLL
jgi:hypothetical protein